MSGFPSYTRVSDEVGIKQLYLISSALVELMPCSSCGAGVGRTCVTIEGKDPGSPTPQHHIARIRSGGALYQIWLRMANEAFDKIDKGEIKCLKKLMIRDD